MTPDPTCPEGCTLTAGITCEHGWRFDPLGNSRAELEQLEHGLAPIDDVPDWCNAFLLELLTNEEHFGTIKRSALAVGKSWWGVDYWREKSPRFAAECKRIYDAVNNAIDDELEHRLLELTLGGVTETTTERIDIPADNDEPIDSAAAREGATPVYRYITKTKHYHDLRSLQWLLERRRRQRYGRDPDPDFTGAGQVTFKFVLGDEKLPDQKPAQADIEGEVTSETDEPVAELDTPRQAE